MNRNSFIKALICAPLFTKLFSKTKGEFDLNNISGSRILNLKKGNEPIPIPYEQQGRLVNNNDMTEQKYMMPNGDIYFRSKINSDGWVEWKLIS